MLAVLTNLGSVGDIQPLFALAAEMRSQGHRPTLALSPYYRSRAAELGFELLPIGPDLDLPAIDRRDVAELTAGGDPRRVAERALTLLASMLPQMFDELRQACRGADVLISGPLQPAARMVHELTQIPFVSIQVNHFGGMREKAEREAIAGVVNPFRGRHGLPPLLDPLFSDGNSPQLALYALSRHLGLTTAGWPEHHRLTGFFFLDEESWRPPPSLIEFLAAGEPPVVISFSSLTSSDPAELTRLLAGAVRRAGCRAIMQHGWSGLAQGDLPPEIHPLGFAPHAWLFPRAGLVVHHGGAQTSAAVLRAGVPAVVVPYVRDQPIWAELCWQLGVTAPPLPHAQLTEESLARVLRETLADRGIRQAAAALGEKVRAEAGARTARRMIEQLVDKVGLSDAPRAVPLRPERRGVALPAIAPPQRPRPAAASPERTLAPEALRVLILCMEYGPSISGGAGTRAMELAQGMARAGHEVTVVSSTLGESRVERQERLTVHLLSISGGEAQSAPGSVVDSLLAWNDQLFARARQLLAGGETLPDLVQCSNWISFPAARRLAREHGFPVLACVEYLSEPIERWWGQQPDPAMVEQEMRMCAEADLLLTVSDSMRQLLHHTYGVDEERIRVVHNGLDPAVFEGSGGPDEGLAKLRRSLLGTADRLVLFAGRLNPMKGITALLEAAAQVIAERPAVRYVVVGETDSRSYGEVVQRLLARHPALQSQVLFLGKVARPQLALLYRAADLALVPSVFDPCPYAPLEAMAAGLPVIGTATGGIGEVVAHEETGLLVPLLPPGPDGQRQVDVAALAAAQLRLLNDEAAARRMGVAGRRRLAARYTRERMLDGTMAVFRDCVDRAGRLPAPTPPAAPSTHREALRHE